MDEFDDREFLGNARKVRPHAGHFDWPVKVTKAGSGAMSRLACGPAGFSNCYPHDQGHGLCVDDGQFYSSTGDCEGGNEPTAPRDRSSLISAIVVQDGRQIRYTLLKDSEVEMEFYDIAGRRLATLDQGPRAAGDHTVKWDQDPRPQGVYFVRLKVDGQVQSAPAVRVRN